jgi:hypothetical protein
VHLRETVLSAPFQKVDPSYNYALSQVFGASLLKKLDDKHYPAKLQALFRSSGLCAEEDEWPLPKSLNVLYDYLSKHYRCEYVYKNEIANQLLLERHSDNSATLLRELASDSSIADIVIVNGNTSAYEIKTELDNFDRLANQLESYQTIYDCLYVVTHERALNTLRQRLNPSVGLIVLDDETRLHEARKAESCTHLFDPAKAVLTLRQTELVRELEPHFGKLPAMGTASIYRYCREQYLNMSKSEARELFYRALKSRRPAAHQFQLILECEKSIKMLLLGRDLPKRLCHTVREHLGLSVA